MNRKRTYLFATMLFAGSAFAQQPVDMPMAADAGPSTVVGDCAVPVMDGASYDLPTGSMGGSVGTEFRSIWETYPTRFRMQLDGLAWSIQGGNYRSLVTTSPAGIDRALAGRIDQPTTSLLVNGRDNQWSIGGRLAALWYRDNFEDHGIEMVSTLIANDNDLINATSDGTSILARPFFNATTGTEDAQLIAFPGLSSGSIKASEEFALFSQEFNFRQNIAFQREWRVEGIYGFRFMAIKNKLTIDESITPVIAGTAFAPGTQILLNEKYDCSNYYLALNLGLDIRYSKGPWSLEMYGKVGLGAVWEKIDIDGNTQVIVQGLGTSTNSGGLLVDQRNIGQETDRMQFAIIPEFGINSRVQLNQRTALRFGYTVLFVDPVLRPADVVERNSVTPILLPPTGVTADRREIRELGDSSLLLHGIHGGIEYRY